jgi:hypothetical protein
LKASINRVKEVPPLENINLKYIVKGVHPLKASIDSVKEDPPLESRDGTSFTLSIDAFKRWNLLYLSIDAFKGWTPFNTIC